jgi:PPOX class probable F420-dependent enzyme
VPICFALVGDRIVTVVDHKPKTTTNLQRITNVRAHPDVTLLVDHWDEDWSNLWWIRVDGRAYVAGGDDDLDPLLLELHGKYRGSYGMHSFDGPAIVVDIERFRGWSASDPT